MTLPHSTRRANLLTGIFLILFLATPHFSFAQQAFIVNDSGDAGSGGCDAQECTFREALDAANADAAQDTILFAIPGDGPHSIAPTTPFPSIEQSVIIDGYSQEGAIPATQEAVAVLKIELNGANTPPESFGLDVLANNVEIYGLAINRFALTGIVFDGVDGGLVAGCYIGTDITGTTALPNGERDTDGIAYDGVWIFKSSNITIGGAIPEDRNILSGNAFAGIYVSESEASSNLIAGNYIGTDATGTSAIGNAESGIVLQNSPQNQIGGADPGMGNLISGNQLDGITIADVLDVNGTASATIIQGNIVGLDVTGENAIPNMTDGIAMLTNDNVIGGDQEGAGNIVSGNEGLGIVIIELADDRTSSGNAITGNIVGLNAAGTRGVGNGSHGIQIEESSNNTITNNLVADNTFSGIRILNTTNGDDIPSNNIVQGNQIGLDLSRSTTIPNNEDGIAITGGHNNIIGGSGEGEENIISGNVFAGIYISDEAEGNSVLGNVIGLYPLEQNAGGNGDAGIDIFGATNNTIGGALEGQGNLIVNNALAGINVTNQRPEGKRASRPSASFQKDTARKSAPHALSPRNRTPIHFSHSTTSKSVISNHFQSTLQAIGEGNALLGNDVFFNGGISIDLGQDGRTINDADDADGGANKGQNYPELTDGTIVGGTLTVNYQVPSSTANSAYPLRIEFFLFGETTGATYIGSDMYAASDAQLAKTAIVEGLGTAFAVDVGSLYATATDAEGNTSEISDLIEVSIEVSSEEEASVPTDFILYDNYPNPFNPETTIQFAVPELAHIQIALFDVLGREVQKILDATYQAGTHTVQLNAGSLPSGTYFFRMQTPGFAETKMLTISK